MKETIKIGYIGLGRRGFDVLRDCITEMKDVEIKYLCDLHEPRLKKAADLLQEKHLPEAILTKEYKQILQDPEVDAVWIMTGWSNHCHLAQEAMQAGKYTAMEVGCAYELQDCWDLVDTYEKTGIPMMLLENCCYGRREMMVLNMVKQGLFGEIVHCDGGYRHYLPDCELFKDLEDPVRHYRINDYKTRNCEQYPTHELGPIAKVLNINRGNRMVRLNSIASKSAGLKAYAQEHLPDYPEFNTEYAQGDIVSTVITCAGGETISLALDTTLPRAYYSRSFTVRGTKGMSCEERKVVFLEGMEEPVQDNEEEFFEKYDHPLHKEYVLLGERGGHDGMDWLTNRAFIESVKSGTNTPIDVYDAASWMCIAVLSAQSIEQNGAPVEFPDFTRGKWQNREPIVEGKYCLNKVCVDETVKIMD